MKTRISPLVGVLAIAICGFSVLQGCRKDGEEAAGKTSSPTTETRLTSQAGSNTAESEKPDAVTAAAPSTTANQADATQDAEGASPGESTPPKATPPKATSPKATPPKPTPAPSASAEPDKKSDRKVAFTADENPTTSAGRGTPDLDSLHSHAAWIFIDGEAGEYVEKDGVPQVQWTVYGPVTRSPTFRVEAYEPLLGKPDGFMCALQTHESYDGSSVLYAIKSNEGKFETGKEYSLLEPGAGFTVIDKMSGKTLDRLPLLSPGIYGMVASVRNSKTGKEGMAVTYFTVGNE